MPRPTSSKPIRITKKHCENAVAAGGDRLVLHDSDCPGLVLRVTPSGVKTFAVVKSVAGRMHRKTLGRFPEVVPESARRMAIEWLGEVARTGAAPSRPSDPSLGDVLAHVSAVYWSKTKGGGVEQRRLVEAYSPTWKTRRLSEISRGDVQAMHTRIGSSRGKYAANRWHEVIRRLYNVADRDYDYPGKNPASGLERFTEQSRERFLNVDEVRRFLAAIEASPHRDARDFLRLLLFIGCRKGALYRMRWSDVAGDTWTIPAMDSKNGRPVKLPLAAPAMEILSERAGNGSPYVFPGRHGRGHIRELRNPVKAIWQAAGIEGVRLHDLRRTLGSWLAASGTSELVIAKSLGHSDTAATKIYARLDLQPVKTAVERVVAAMQGDSR